MSLAIAFRKASHHLNDPTPEERVRIEQVLLAARFTGWDEIALDDDGSEVWMTLVGRTDVSWA